MSLWLRRSIIIPNVSAAELNHEEMPEDVLKLYLEASAIVGASPRGAAALLRVALELLTHKLGADPKKKISDKIGILVEKGLPDDVARAFDVLRVTGNNAAHTSGTLLLDDDLETATAMFRLLNDAVEQTIARPNKLTMMYDRLPEGVRAAIEKRDQKVPSIPKSD